MKKIFSILCIVFLAISIVGCKKKTIIVKNPDRITLNYYKLYENEEDMQPFFTEFQKKYPYVSINYRKFTDYDKFLETIVDEIAEGGGPDIISVPNTWVPQNYKKISPAPEDIATPQVFRDVFVDVAAKDNVLITEDGTEKVYGIPLTVDTLSLYYNDNMFEQSIPERGKPSATWTGLTTDSSILTLRNFETNSIKRSGIALGTGESIIRSPDIFYLLTLQNNLTLYNKDLRSAKFTNTEKVTDVVKFISSFANPNSSNYSWNDALVNPDSIEKELEAFVTGKTAMIFGYSHLYKDLLNLILVKNRQGIETIKSSDIKIAESPQLTLTQENKVTYAHYYTETVSRNSKHPREAWLLLTSMSEKENLQKWYKKNFKPTSRRDLITEQRSNPIYGAFINQLGYAKTMPIINDSEYAKIFKQVFDNSLLDQNYRAHLITAESNINALIPQEGVFPNWPLKK